MSELLCFLRCKLSSVPAENLLQVCKDFYSENEILQAKTKLFECQVDWVSVNQRNIKRKLTTRSSKASLDLDDVLKALQAADSACLKLPSFVALDLNRIPAVSPESVDLCVLAGEIRALSKKVCDMESREKKSYAAVTSADRLPVQTGNVARCQNEPVSEQSDKGEKSKVSSRSSQQSNVDSRDGNGSDWETVQRSIARKRKVRGVV